MRRLTLVPNAALIPLPILIVTPVNSGAVSLAGISTRLDVVGWQFETGVTASGPWSLLFGGNGSLVASVSQLGLTGGKTYFYRAKVYYATGSSAYSVVKSVTTPGSLFSAATSASVIAGALTSQVPATGIIRYTPGHWVTINGTYAGLQGQINNAAALGMVGVYYAMNWSALEFAEGTYTNNKTGSSAQGFALVDQLIAWCAAVGLKLGILYSDRTFFAHTYTTPDANICNLPEYFNTLSPTGGNGYYLAPSGTVSGGLGGISLLDQPYVMDRHIALGNAYIGRYDTNAAWEVWTTPETAVGAPVINNANMVTQWIRWGQAVRAATAKNSRLRISTNFLGSNAQMVQLMTGMATAAVDAGGPDNGPIPWSGNPTAGQVNSMICYLGTRSTGPGFKGNLQWTSEAQFPDVTYNAGAVIYPQTGGWAAQDVYNFHTLNKTIAGIVPTPNPSDWGGVNPGIYVWFYNTSSGINTVSGVAPSIPNMPVNKARPSCYAAFGG